jgi:hypothetical protein
MAVSREAPNSELVSAAHSNGPVETVSVFTGDVNGAAICVTEITRGVAQPVTMLAELNQCRDLLRQVFYQRMAPGCSPWNRVDRSAEPAGNGLDGAQEREDCWWLTCDWLWLFECAPARGR